MPARQLECYINNETVKDLIAVYLQSINVIRSSEDVCDLAVGAVGDDGLRKLTVKFDRATDIIFHP